MSYLQRRGVSSPLARALGLASLAFATALAWPAPAAAHVGCCVQCVNPHGSTIPPAGSALACKVGTMPSTKAGKAGVNPDGFFQVGTALTEGGTCTAGTSDVKLFSCTNVVLEGGQFRCADAGTPICEAGDTSCIFENGTLIKYTQASGAKTPTVTPMGSNNGRGFGAGGVVTFRIKASGDLMVCSADNPAAPCAVCPVPRPPK